MRCSKRKATPHPPLPRSPFSHRRRLRTVHIKGVTHYTLQDKAYEKEYEQNCSYSLCCRAGGISRRSLCLYRLFSAAASHRPTMLRESKTCFIAGTRSTAFVYILLCGLPSASPFLCFDITSSTSFELSTVKMKWRIVTFARRSSSSRSAM